MTLAGAKRFWSEARALAVTALLLAVASVQPAYAQESLKGVALVIGQSKYEHIAALPNPANDARDVVKLLTDMGFDARSVSDRDAAKLKRDLQRFVEDAEGADVALLYYSGHGIEAGGENWLLPVDADVSSLANATEALVPLSGTMDRLKQTVPVAIVLLDACRTNPFPADAVVRRQPGDSGQAIAAGGLAPLRGAVALGASKPAADNLGTVIGFAAEPGQPALDGSAGENSPYASALLRHLGAMQGAEFGAVMRMVTEEVYLDTKGKQRPWVNESLRRMLYFGVALDQPTGDDALVTGERRQLLLTIAELPDIKRSQVELAASKDNVPLDSLYGVLRALGTDKIPEDPTELEKVLDAQAERLTAMFAERDALSTDDPEIARLATAADSAIREGAIAAARQFLDRAIARVEAGNGAVDSAEDAVKRKRIADAAVYAQRASASTLAFDYVAAANDYAKAFDLIEKWDDKLRWNYKNLQAEALGKHGDITGDRKALDEAVTAYGVVLDMIPRGGEQSRDFAMTNNNLATVLETIGERETGTQTLERAVELYRQSLNYFSATDDDENWAAAQNNVGNVLISIGERRGDIDVLEQAVDAHRAALARRDRAKSPYEWASSHNNLGLALYKVAEAKGGGKLYDEAEASYRQALLEWTRAKHPAEWSMTLNNLGNCLNAQGNEQADPAKFQEASDVFRQALEFRTRETFPLSWANTQLNLGVTLVYTAKFSTGTAEVEEAVGLYRDLIEALPRDTLPLEWASAQTNYGSALQLLGQRTLSAGPVEQSVDRFTEARQVYTREDFPLDWAMTYLNAGNSLKLLAGLTQNAGQYGDAADAYREALKEYRRDRVPEQWAIVQANLGSVLQAIGDLASLRQSIDARKAALEVLTIENSRIDWANAQSGLGMSLNNLGLFEQTSKYADAAEAAFLESLKVFREDTDPIQWAFGHNNIGDVYWNRGTIDADKAALRTALTHFGLARGGFERGGGQMMIPLLDKKVELVEQQLAK